MDFKLQPLFDLRALTKQKDQNAPKLKITFACTLPMFEPGYNFDEDGVSTLKAHNDWEAILEFLNLYQSAHTIRSYASEIEKFILWLILYKQMPISGIKRDDWNDYLRFMNSVPPELTGERSKRFLGDGQPNPSWKPFYRVKTQLAENSLAKTAKIIEALFAFLVSSGYLKASPVISQRRRTKTVTERSIEISERFIPQELLDTAIDVLNNISRDLASNKTPRVQGLKTKLLRSLYIIQLLRDLGLRAAELVALRMGDISVDKAIWSIKVVGKGNKVRKLKIPDRLRDTIMDFRVSQGKPPYPTLNDPDPLVGSLKGNQFITTRRLGQLIAESFGLVACHLETNAAKLDKTSHEYGQLIRNSSVLSQASTHWLRHSHATEFLAESNNNLISTMRRLGHSAPNVTSVYLHTNDDDIF